MFHFSFSPIKKKKKFNFFFSGGAAAYPRPLVGPPLTTYEPSICVELDNEYKACGKFNVKGKFNGRKAKERAG